MIKKIGGFHGISYNLIQDGVREEGRRETGNGRINSVTKGEKRNKKLSYHNFYISTNQHGNFPKSSSIQYNLTKTRLSKKEEGVWVSKPLSLRIIHRGHDEDIRLFYPIRKGRAIDLFFDVLCFYKGD